MVGVVVAQVVVESGGGDGGGGGGGEGLPSISIPTKAKHDENAKRTS